MVSILITAAKLAAPKTTVHHQQRVHINLKNKTQRLNVLETVYKPQSTKTPQSTEQRLSEIFIHQEQMFYDHPLLLPWEPPAQFQHVTLF